MVTIKDVAELAVVSTATVSRVINNKGPLSKETIEKVNKAVVALNYNPNTIARSLARGVNNCFGIILPSIQMPYWAQVAHEVEKAAGRRGYSITIVVSPKMKNDYIHKFQYLAASRPAGIITSYFDGIEEFIAISQIPVLTWANSLKSKPSISSDDYHGGCLATRHLIAKGCRNIVHISGNLSFPSSGNQRTFAFMDECKKRGVKYTVVQTNGLSIDYNEAISQIFSAEHDYDGIFASNDVIAARCLSMALSLGIKVPEELKIIGYDGTNISRLVYPPLSTIHQDIEELAERAIATLLSMVEGKDVPDRQILPVRLIERKTT